MNIKRKLKPIRHFQKRIFLLEKFEKKLDINYLYLFYVKGNLKYFCRKIFVDKNVSLKNPD